MFYSGLLVTALPDRYDEAVAALAGVESAQIHQQDRAGNRFIVTVENESVNGESDTFNLIRTLPGVANVSLIVHREDA